MARIFAYIAHKGGVADDSAPPQKRSTLVHHLLPSSPVGVRTLMPSAKACDLLTARYGKWLIKLSPIPTLNWSAKPW